MTLGVPIAAESTEGERPPIGNSSGGKDVWRRCEGPATADGLRRLAPDIWDERAGRLREMGVPLPGGDPAYGGEVAMSSLCV
jgi:hypothetical protein